MPRHTGPAENEQRPDSRDLRVLGQLFGFLRPYAPVVIAAALALMVAAAAVLGFGIVLQRVVDNGLNTGSAEALNQALLLFLLVVTVMTVSVAARVYLVTWIGERVVADVRKAVFAKVLLLEPAFFEVMRTGEVISRITTDTSLLQVVVGSTLAIAVRNALLISGGLVMLFITSGKLALLVMLGVPLAVIPLWLLGHRVRNRSRITQDRIADIGAFIDEVLYGIQTVQAFCHEAIDRRRYGEQVEAAFQAAIARTRVSAMLTALVMLFTFMSISVVLWVGGHDVLAGRISGGQLSAFVFYALLVAGSVSALSEVAGELLRAAGYDRHITAGGHFASLNAETLLREHPAFDSVLHGDGEPALVDQVRFGDQGAEPLLQDLVIAALPIEHGQARFGGGGLEIPGIFREIDTEDLRCHTLGTCSGRGSTRRGSAPNQSILSRPKCPIKRTAAARANHTTSVFDGMCAVYSGVATCGPDRRT